MQRIYILYKKTLMYIINITIYEINIKKINLEKFLNIFYLKKIKIKNKKKLMKIFLYKIY